MEHFAFSNKWRRGGPILRSLQPVTSTLQLSLVSFGQVLPMFDLLDMADLAGAVGGPSLALIPSPEKQR